MSLQHFGKATLRVAKNYTKGYSDIQAKVREATSNDPWGPSGAQMNDISQLTYNQNDFIEIMEMLDKRLNDKGKNWRHVFKALTLLDYLLHGGSENVVLYFRDNIYIIKTLKEFQFVDEYGKDLGANVRQKAKDITNLLQDESRLRDERRTRAHMRDRLSGGAGGPEHDYDIENENLGRRSTSANRAERKPTKQPTDDELNKAIEASKRSLADERARAGILSAEERDLQKAIQLSEEEEARRNKALEDANASSLFDDQAQQNANNPFPLVDFDSQLTLAQPQPFSFNPYQQQLEQQAAQAEYLRQQQEWERQQQEAQLQAQYLAQQQAQQLAQQQQQEEWSRQQQQQQQQDEWNRQQQLLQYQQQQAQLAALQQPSIGQPAGFGSNNPFSTFGSPSPQAHSPISSSISNFTLPSTFASSPAPSTATYDTSLRSPSTISSQRPSSTRPTPAPTQTDGQHAHLANLLANREDGIDTFGNIGNLRYGATQAGRQLIAQQPPNSHNPFSQYQQPQQQNNEQPFFTV